MKISVGRLRELIWEAVVLAEGRSAQEAINMGLALWIEPNSDGGEELILWEPGAYPEDSGVAKSIATRAPESFVKAYMSTAKPLRSCNGAMEVGLSSGQEGWGNFLYDVAMSRYPLVSDRTGMTSAAAKSRAWSRIFNDPQVQSRQMDNADLHKGKTEDETADPDLHPGHTPTEEDDCRFVGGGGDDRFNKSYERKTPIYVSELQMNHMAAKQELKDVEQLLKIAAARFFSRMYTSKG